MVNIDNILVIGISHLKSDLEEREEFIKKIKPKKIKELMIREFSADSVILVETCLRAEFYIWGKNFNIDECKKVFREYDKVFIKNGIEAARHLFHVVCGLDSIIVGEEQILSQIKAVYLDSIENEKIDRELNVLFNKAIELGKKFRAVSKINSNPISLENIAVKFVERRITLTENTRVLFLGTGELNNAILKIIIKKNIKNITAANRMGIPSLGNDNSIKYIDFSEKYSVAFQSDVIFSATKAPHHIIEYNEYIKNHANRKQIFIDLAVPRDIDPELKKIDGINVFNLEEINEELALNEKRRKKIGEEYNYLIEEQIAKWIKWYRGQK